VTDQIEQLPIKRFTREGKHDAEDVIIREFPLTIILNGQELVTLLCSPTDLKYLAVGYLFSEGLINSKEEIKNVTVDDQRGIARVETTADRESDGEVIFKRLITSGCGRGASFLTAADAENLAKVQSETAISPTEIFNLVKEFQHHSEVYRETGGVHSAALCDRENILVFSEDIGRHNAVDKIFGECILKDITTDDHIIITSGRVSSEIVIKVARRNMPILISKSAPTNVAVRLGGQLGLTLIGFVRGSRMNVYTNDWRIKANGNQ